MGAGNINQSVEKRVVARGWGSEERRRGGEEESAGTGSS